MKYEDIMEIKSMLQDDIEFGKLSDWHRTRIFRVFQQAITDRMLLIRLGKHLAQELTEVEVRE